MGHLNRDMKIMEGALRVSGGRSFWAKEKMCTKALGQKYQTVFEE